MKTSSAIRGISAIVAIILAATVEHYSERLFVVRTSSGLRETYNGPLTQIAALVIFVAVAAAVYAVGSQFARRWSR
jgi:hypothetical protein